MPIILTQYSVELRGVQVWFRLMHDDRIRDDERHRNGCHTNAVYQEFIGRHGYGFHHWAIGSRDLDATVEEYRREGYQLAFSDRSPRGVRIVYMDISDASVPGMLEIIEIMDALEDLYLDMHKASLDWDGADLFRKAASVNKSSHLGRTGSTEAMRSTP